MEELFKKVYIKTEADCPKVEGDYFCNRLGFNSVQHLMTTLSKSYMREIRWYLQPIEQPSAPVSAEETISPDVVTKMQHEFEPNPDTTFKQGMYSGYAFGLQDGYEYSQLSQPKVKDQEPQREYYPVIAIDDIDVETVKRWFQLFMGFDDDSRMRDDIEAMARASYLNKHLNWKEEPQREVKVPAHLRNRCLMAFEELLFNHNADAVTLPEPQLKVIRKLIKDLQP